MGAFNVIYSRRCFHEVFSDETQDLLRHLFDHSVVAVHY